MAFLLTWRSTRRLVAAVVAVLVLGTAAASATTVRHTTGMYGKRYCEFLVVTGQLPHLTGTVWNTYGLNDCPPDRWKAVDLPKLTSDLGALTVRANGPRYWLMDRATIWNPGPVRTLAGLRMRELTTFEVPITNGVPGQLPYAEVTINRRTTFVWGRGRTVHELLAPGGRVYVMQAYSQIVDASLQRSQLAALGARISLPAGWRYRSVTLKRDLSLHTDGKATIIQDELQDTYQRLR